jgi:His/Glu/Gln/Arg/opine family amino acid ABC transporter permease subunit
MNFTLVMGEASPLLMRGLVITVQTTIIALIIALALGLIACLAGMSRFPVPRIIAKAYIWVIRGTPLLVQVFFVYFGVPQLLQSLGFDFRLTPFVAGVITLSMNAGAYIAEIFRGGIEAIDHGQMEAARSLGLSHYRAMFKIILPQAVRISIPALVNQFIISLKDTSIISIISLADIVYQARIYIGRTYQSFATWTIVGLFYLVIITVLSQISTQVEKRLDYGQKSRRQGSA